jgi:hypothetical protein
MQNLSNEYRDVTPRRNGGSLSIENSDYHQGDFTSPYKESPQKVLKKRYESVQSEGRVFNKAGLQMMRNNSNPAIKVIDTASPERKNVNFIKKNLNKVVFKMKPAPVHLSRDEIQSPKETPHKYYGRVPTYIKKV